MFLKRNNLKLFLPVSICVFNRNFYQKLTKINKNHQTLSIWWSPCFFLPWIISFIVVLLIYNALPTGIVRDDEVSNDNKIKNYVDTDNR